ncbi:MAG: YjjG family noncanonical pyrimidine nucleotidase [Clostridia bacterium]|nr:YjjG family noncanonical pyrimidine nucleotidase [Clostridia bacterium]
MIRDIFLDVDDTILDFGRAEREALASALSQMGVEVNEEALHCYHEVNLAHWKMLERGEITRERLLVRRFEEFYKRIEVNADAERTQRIYEYELGCRSYYLDGAEALLESLVQGGYRIYLASNGTTVVQSPRIKASGLDRICHGIFLSEAIGCDKPQKAFFDACFESIGDFVPENAIILGDSLSSDIAGGRNAGIKTCWFNPKKIPLTGDVTPDFEISELSEFLEILKA